MKLSRLMIGGVVVAIVIAIGLSAYELEKPSTGASTPSPQEAVDTSVGQYTDNPNAPVAQTQPAAPAQSQGQMASAVAPVQAQPLVPGCSLHFSFVPSLKSVAPGGQITYAIALTNVGEAACQNASFSIYYSGDEQFVSSSPKARSNNYYWVAGNLASRQTYAVTVTTAQVSNDDSGQVSNEACATADNGADACVNNLILVGSTVAAPAASTAAVAAQTAPVAQNTTPAATAFTGSILPIGQKMEMGIWEWNTPLEMTPSYESQILTTLSADGFNAVYISVDDYLDVASMPVGAAKTQAQNAYFAKLATFVQLANGKGIAVDAEGGAKDWAEPQNNWEGFDLIDMVNAYNAAYPQAKLRGFQYDVESYLLPGYANNEAGTLQQYLSFIDQSVQKMEGSSVQFTIVLPYFYNSQQQWTPPITYNGTSAYAYTQLLNVLQKKPGSRIIIMAYRNTFAGANGVQQVSLPDITDAAQSGYSTQVIVAQETGNVQPSYVTFYGETRAALSSQLQQITAAYRQYPDFAGVAVDYVDPFLALK